MADLCGLFADKKSPGATRQDFDERDSSKFATTLPHAWYLSVLLLSDLLHFDI